MKKLIFPLMILIFPILSWAQLYSTFSSEPKPGVYHVFNGGLTDSSRVPMEIFADARFRLQLSDADYSEIQQNYLIEGKMVRDTWNMRESNYFKLIIDRVYRVNDKLAGLWHPYIVETTLKELPLADFAGLKIELQTRKNGTMYFQDTALLQIKADGDLARKLALFTSRTDEKKPIQTFEEPSRYPQFQRFDVIQSCRRGYSGK